MLLSTRTSTLEWFGGLDACNNRLSVRETHRGAHSPHDIMVRGLPRQTWLLQASARVLGVNCVAARRAVSSLQGRTDSIQQAVWQLTALGA